MNCTLPECQTTAGCAHRGPKGEMCWSASPIARLAEAARESLAEIEKVERIVVPGAVANALSNIRQALKNALSD
jgi:hypothetical protein